jgi:hypothetical protein
MKFSGDGGSGAPSTSVTTKPVTAPNMSYSA